mgnify:CR=1 FL=1
MGACRGHCQESVEHADHLDRAKAARNELIQVSPEGVALVRQRHAKDIEAAAGDPEKLAAIERLIEADLLAPGIW